MITDLRWAVPQDGRGEARLEMYRLEIAGFDEDRAPHFTGRGEWEEVPVIQKSEEPEP
jgi:hypothetical protein